MNVPSIKEVLKVGMQFGHEAKRWNPKMSKYIFGERNGIHIIDVSQTLELLKKSSEFLAKASAQGPVIFIGTKPQASTIVKDAAIKAGAFYVDKRWAGGLLTNYEVVKSSLKKLNDLERMFEEGVGDRTKYEVSLMKREWQRLARLYSGIKSMTGKPTAAVIIDIKYENGAVRECRRMGIPVIGIVDTNTDPDNVDYVIPANDDAIGSIKLIVDTLADAVAESNQGKGIKHELKDYSKVEVKITKTSSIEESNKGESVIKEQSAEPKIFKQRPTGRVKKGQGILERVKKDNDNKSKVVKKTTKKNA